MWKYLRETQRHEGVGQMNPNTRDRVSYVSFKNDVKLKILW